MHDSSSLGDKASRKETAMRERKGFETVQPAERPSPRPKAGDGDRRPGEGVREYELRKALEATPSGDTRTKRDRF